MFIKIDGNVNADLMAAIPYVAKSKAAPSQQMSAILLVADKLGLHEVRPMVERIEWRCIKWFVGGAVFTGGFILLSMVMYHYG